METTVREIFLYASRRLYDRAVGRPVTYDDVFFLVRAGVPVVVKDFRKKTDITAKVLLEGVIRQESNCSDRVSILTAEFLLELIRSSTADPQLPVGQFLSHTIQTWAQTNGELTQAEK